MHARTAWVVGASLSAFGCAQILGADFDGAALGDAGTADASLQHDAGAADAVPDAGEFDPRSLGHLALWLSSNAGVTEAPPDAGPPHSIAQWDDRSGQNHPAIGSDPSRRPTWVDAGGTALVAFDRTQRTCLTDAWTDAGIPSTVTLFVVGQGDTTDVLRFGSRGAIAFPWDANYARVQGDQPDLRVLVAPSMGTQMAPMLGSQGAAREVLSASLTARQIGGLRAYRNGILTEQTSLLDADLPPLDALAIGCADNAGEYAGGLVAEVLVYLAALSDTDRARVEQYLGARWQVTVRP